MSAVVKPNSVAFDTALICAVVGLIADRHDHGRVGVGLDRRGRAVALLRPPSRRRRRRPRRARARRVAADRALVSPGLGASGRGLGAARDRARPRVRPCRQRQPTLARARTDHRAGFGARAARHPALSRELRRAPPSRARCKLERLGEAVVRRRSRRRAAVGRARLRRDGRARCHEPHGAVRRRRAPARSLARRARRRCGAHGARVLGRLSRRAAHVVPRSVGRSVRHRLPVDASADGDRPRRMGRRGPRRKRAEAVLSARGAHGFRVRRARRGARLRRRDARHRAVRHRRLSRDHARARSHAQRHALPRARRDRHRRHARLRGVRQHGRQRGAAADEGIAAAADQLRPSEHRRHARRRSVSCCGSITSSTAARSGSCSGATCDERAAPS